MSPIAMQATFTLGELATAAGARLLGQAAERRATGVSIDTRSLRTGELFVAVAGPRFDGHDFLAAAASRGAVAAMVSREVLAPPGLDLIRVEDTTLALGDLARHIRLGSGLPVVAITGSTGKTTTKEMTAGLLEGRGPVLRSEGNLNNRYGVPLTLFQLKPEHTAVVLEMGMSAPGELALLTRIGRPDVAVITNVAPVHLQFFDSVDSIARAKAEILEGLRTFGAAVLNWDDERVRKIGHLFHGDVVWFGRDRSCDVSAENLRGTIHGMRFDLRLDRVAYDVALPLLGEHAVMNFLAAAAAAHRFGVKGPEIAERASLLKPAARRGQALRLNGGITLLDDTYNSNPVAVGAAVAALAFASGRKLAFLGDMLELGEDSLRLHEEAGERIASGLDAIVGIGPLAAALIKGATRSGLQSGACQWFADAAGAAAAASRIVRPGDAVLVKGSRSVRMEQVVDALQAHFGLLEA